MNFLKFGSFNYVTQFPSVTGAFADASSVIQALSSVLAFLSLDLGRLSGNSGRCIHFYTARSPGSLLFLRIILTVAMNYLKMLLYTG